MLGISGEIPGRIHEGIPREVFEEFPGRGTEATTEEILGEILKEFYEEFAKELL